MKKFFEDMKYTVKYGITAFGILFLILLVLVGMAVVAEKFGYMAGVILSASLAAIITVIVLIISNDVGYHKGTIQDYTKKPMDLSEKQVYPKREFWKKEKYHK